MAAASPAARFAEVFTEGMKLGDAERFIAHFEPYLAPDAQFHQPLAPTWHGREGFARGFRGLFGLIPDLRGQVHGWVTEERTLFIEFTLSGTLGGRPISWRAVDRFSFDEAGLVCERINFFDPLPVIGALLTRPPAWRRAGLALRRPQRR